MWVADMDFKTPDFIINAIQKRLEHEIFGYTYIPTSFYDSVVKWNQRRHNWDIDRNGSHFHRGLFLRLICWYWLLHKPGDNVIDSVSRLFSFFLGS